MIKLGGWVGGLLCAGYFICSAAAPFDALSVDAPAQVHLQSYVTAGLIENLPAPSTGLSRLQAALLVKRALVAYGQAQLDGIASNPELEVALQADLAEFAAELEVMDAETMATLLPAPSSTRPLRKCVGPTEEDCAPCSEPCAPQAECSCGEDESGAEDPCDVKQIEFTPYGDVALQLRATRTDVAAGHIDTSDVTFYWGEVGVDAKMDSLTGHVSALLNDRAASVDLHEAYASWREPDADLGIKAGRMVLPPGSRLTTFPTYPAAVDLAYTTATGVGVQVGDAKSALSVYAFNPAAEIAGENDTLSDYAVGLHLSTTDDSAADGFEFNATYTSHLAAGNLRLAGAGPLQSRVGGVNSWAELRWGGEHRLLAEYSAALDAFNPADLDADGDGAGDRPKAFDAEYIHTSAGGDEFGVSWQETRQMADYAKRRWALMAGKRVNDWSTFRVELSRGTFDGFSTAGATRDLQLVTELRVKY